MTTWLVNLNGCPFARVTIPANLYRVSPTQVARAWLTGDRASIPDGVTVEAA